MPKIRGIKPDIWTDEDFIELSPLARLLFIGLWNFACDNGHVQDKSKQIKMRILPGDDVNCAELLRELVDAEMIERINGWIRVPNFRKHQRLDRRWFQTCEAPGCRESSNPQPETRSGHGEPPARPPRDHDEHTSGPRRHVDVEGDVDSDGEGERKKTLDHPQAADRLTKPADHDFDRFWDAYPRRIGKGQARKAWKTATKKLEADQIIIAASAYTARAGNQDPKFIPHPATWLNGERWADEPDPDFTAKSSRQEATDDLFDRAMARAAERDNDQKAIGA